jgi:hypothetical protein
MAIRSSYDSKVYYGIKRAALGKDVSRLSIQKHTGWTFDQAKEHIEKSFSHPNNLTPDGNIWMHWGNWGKYNPATWNDKNPKTWKWQLDHIIPHSTFKYEIEGDKAFRECWNLNNLRALSAKLNIRENNRGHKKSKP